MLLSFAFSLYLRRYKKVNIPSVGPVVDKLDPEENKAGVLL
jgi:hypothetical protein